MRVSKTSAVKIVLEDRIRRRVDQYNNAITEKRQSIEKELQEVKKQADELRDNLVRQYLESLPCIKRVLDANILGGVTMIGHYKLSDTNKMSVTINFTDCHATLYLQCDSVYDAVQAVSPELTALKNKIEEISDRLRVHSQDRKYLQLTHIMNDAEVTIAEMTLRDTKIEDVEELAKKLVPLA